MIHKKVVKSQFQPSFFYFKNIIFFFSAKIHLTVNQDIVKTVEQIFVLFLKSQIWKHY